MALIERAVWHKDGPVAQIRAMIEWLGTPYERPDDEHIGKVQTNLGAAADALEGAVGAFERVAKLADAIQRDRSESDKVLAYAMELRNLAYRNGGGQS